MSVSLLAAFTLGLFGSLHCLGMCGPLVLRMPFAQVQTSWRIWAILGYHTGKTLAYSLLGLLAGLIGRSFLFFKWQQGLTILAGFVLLAITLLPYIKHRMHLPAFMQRYWNKLMQQTGSHSTVGTLTMLGFMNGLLPCGLVYAAFAGASVQGNVWTGMLFMACFGLGTIPSLSAVILLRQQFGARFRHYFSRTSVVLSCVIGLLLILRGLNLGIPYVSPHADIATGQMDCCHRPTHHAAGLPKAK